MSRQNLLCGQTVFELFDKIFAATDEIAQVEIKPKMMGRKLIAQLSPEKKK